MRKGGTRVRGGERLLSGSPAALTEKSNAVQQMVVRRRLPSLDCKREASTCERE